MAWKENSQGAELFRLLTLENLTTSENSFQTCFPATQYNAEGGAHLEPKPAKGFDHHRIIVDKWRDKRTNDHRQVDHDEIWLALVVYYSVGTYFYSPKSERFVSNKSLIGPQFPNFDLVQVLGLVRPHSGLGLGLGLAESRTLRIKVYQV